jgi:gamma-glutamylputrescine oxidase
MNLSFWEIRSWLSHVDFCIVGSGITGISCALELHRIHPNARILILERGVFPQGASTKNAGFACYGSLTEILEDLQTHTEEEVQALVARRLKGIGLLKQRLGESAMDYRQYGGFEIFLDHERETFASALNHLERINTLLQPIFGRAPFELHKNGFGFRGILPDLICNPLEGQIDTGKVMQGLLALLKYLPVDILNGIGLVSYQDLGNHVEVITDKFTFKTKKLILATNGFAGPQTGLAVVPARAQVLITNPIPNLPVRGCFHMDAGYYYFRNIGNRLLFGGGRNLDKVGETTLEFGETALLQDRLESLLKEVILPDTKVAIAHRWSGIMGVGPQRKPLLERLTTNVTCGVRLGGMGVALGSQVGLELAELASESW